MRRNLSVIPIVVLLSSIVVFAEDPGAENSVQKSKLPDLELRGGEVNEKSLSKIAHRDWGIVRLIDGTFTGSMHYQLTEANSIRSLRLSGKNLSGYLWRLKDIKGLTELEIYSPIRVNDLEAIANLKQLERLMISSDSVINVLGAREIAKLVDLKSLNVSRTDLDDASLAELRTLSNLEELDLSETRITDDGLATLDAMPRLRILNLSRQLHIRQRFTDACVPAICRLTDLESLTLSGKITNPSLDELCKRPKLKTLSIYYTEIDAEGLVALKNSSVEWLHVGWHQIGGPDGMIRPMVVESLKNCPRLKSVFVTGRQFFPSEKLFEFLKNEFPEIEWSFNS